MDNATQQLWSNHAELQFVLVDDKRRLYQARCYCYLGSIDDWVEIGKGGPLATLAKRYIKHLGQESYFELF
ncbi:MAG TPA: hypothetical protein VI750_07685 [Pyrinomonadaceae bacterium]|nr:hypothetical protein [Pyrinomonadaceae bacterium]HLE63003.1 hypothetical protein [Pyrinomonadaceae bacterium]